MSETVDPEPDLSPEWSVPCASLESILCTQELQRRESRPPDYEKENRALVALASALADAPNTVLQTLAETILEITESESAGISLLTREEGGRRFYWPAIAGLWAPHVGGGTPRNFGPCGDVLDRNCTLMFTHIERRYTYFMPITPPAEECLLVPFYVGGKAVGTMWALMHSGHHKFDAEDQRVMESLGRFASSAYQAIMAIDDLKVQIVEREKAQGALRDLADSLETQVRARTEELERSEAFLAEAQRLASTGSYSWRVATDEITWSDELFRIFELAPPLTPARILTRVHPDDAASFERMVEQARRGGDDFEWQYRLMMPDGSIKHLRTIAQAARDQDGQIEYIAAVQDVTARRLSEEALDKARSDLARASRVLSLGVLTASIAHEVNQPLSGIITNASTCLRMLDAEPPNVEGARETAQRTIRDGRRASDVITRLRALFSRKAAAIELVDLNEAAKEVIALSRVELERNRVILRAELDSDLQQVTGDRVQLQQVILNLLRNASESMSAVDDRPRQLVVTTEQDRTGCAVLTVRDSGVGFDPQIENKLFDAFYTTKDDGMGIGLSVSRSIIENHRGRLSAKRNEGPGAAFSFSIPCATA